MIKKIFIASLITIFFEFAFSLIFIKAFTLAIDSTKTLAMSDLFGLGMIAALIACIVVTVWAIPVHLVLNKLKKFHIGWYILSALIPCLGLITLELQSTHPVPALGLPSILFGVPGAAVFWYFSVYRIGAMTHRPKCSEKRSTA
ncbi:hypothetical protein RI845_12660 [Thalassotalea nanhaiensis]|uniref:DUF2569 domain-containing protein n=1 Tax=Thalassotalea nanhaiensis TaxID=3065648 RepID=A0ABY9TF20_9GAMM|nr:hypothetical protein RI845_12660 [Colwelliaceae bacterium SQ345]